MRRCHLGQLFFAHFARGAPASARRYYKDLISLNVAFDPSVHTGKLYENQVCSAFAEQMRKVHMEMVEYGKNCSEAFAENLRLRDARSEEIRLELANTAKELRKLRTYDDQGKGPVAKWAAYTKETSLDKLIQKNFYSPDLCAALDPKKVDDGEATKSDFDSALRDFLNRSSTIAVLLKKNPGESKYSVANK